jgi:hypothetical protein
LIDAVQDVANTSNIVSNTNLIFFRVIDTSYVFALFVNLIDMLSLNHTLVPSSFIPCKILVKNTSLFYIFAKQGENRLVFTQWTGKTETLESPKE